MASAVAGPARRRRILISWWAPVGLAAISFLVGTSLVVPNVLRRHTASLVHPDAGTVPLPDRRPIAAASGMAAIAPWEEQFFRPGGHDLNPEPEDEPPPRARAASVEAAPSPADEPPGQAAVQPEPSARAAAAEAEPAPVLAPSPESVRDLSRAEDAREVQQKLAALGHFDGAPTGIWGERSRGALKSFKRAESLADDEAFDRETEERLFGARAASASFVGVWGPSANACSPKLNRGGFLPAVIANDGAWAGETSCSFGPAKAVSPTAWSVAATCSNGRRRWTSLVSLSVTGDRLLWSSKRGSQVYVRCPQRPATSMASAG